MLALLCLLLTRPRMALTREEVADSLWPDHDPNSALNSLNQTVYFLRRVFEPDYAEDLSPGYVGQDGETIWLDPELVGFKKPEMPRASFERCQGSRRRKGRLRWRLSTPGALHWTSRTKSGRPPIATAFTLLTFESWSMPYDWTSNAGHLDRATFLAERAAEADPESEEIQLSLTRLYRHSGAFAAAAEQYGHYANLAKDLGVEPVPPEDL